MPRRREGRRPQAGEREEKENLMTSIGFFLYFSFLSFSLFPPFFGIACPSFSCSNRYSRGQTTEWGRWILETTGGTAREKGRATIAPHTAAPTAAFFFLLLSPLSFALPLRLPLSPPSHLVSSLLHRSPLRNERKRNQGPNLGGLFGRQSGTIDGFSYSKANKEKAVKW